MTTNNGTNMQEEVKLQREKRGGLATLQQRKAYLLPSLPD